VIPESPMFKPEFPPQGFFFIFPSSITVIIIIVSTDI
jgi:hypothetical protein